MQEESAFIRQSIVLQKSAETHPPQTFYSFLSWSRCSDIPIHISSALCTKVTAGSYINIYIKDSSHPKHIHLCTVFLSKTNR